VDKPWGITVTELTYEPPAADGAGLSYIRDDQAVASRFAPCYAQESPARRLPKMAGVPVAVVTSQASYHSAFDHCTVRFLREAGVNVDHLMLEKNSDEVASVILRWLASRGLAGN
jgi:hypothetical protein